MRAEHLKMWLRWAEEEEEAEKEGAVGLEGAGDTWRLLVRLIQHVWDTGEIPSQMLLTIIILIPKGNSWDFCGIGLLEVVWEVIEKIIDTRLKCVPLHDALHGFWPGRGCSTAIMEVKRVTQLGSLEKSPFFGICVDPQKACNAMDRDRYFKILRDVGVSEKTVRLIVRFWKQSSLCCRAVGY